jgi:cobalt/nickel transport system permease protein
VHLHLVDRYQTGASIVHRLDPRVKILLVLTYILGLTLTPPGAWASYAAFFGLALAAAAFSGLGLGFAVRRSYVALPFILAAAALPFDPGPGLPPAGPGLGGERARAGALHWHGSGPGWRPRGR